MKIKKWALKQQTRIPIYCLVVLCHKLLVCRHMLCVKCWLKIIYIYIYTTHTRTLTVKMAEPYYFIDRLRHYQFHSLQCNHNKQNKNNAINNIFYQSFEIENGIYSLFSAQSKNMRIIYENILLLLWPHIFGKFLLIFLYLFAIT